MKDSFICFIILVIVIPGVDGQMWEIFDSENSPLPESDVNSLFVDEFGGKWFGTNRGLVHYMDNYWNNYTSNDNLASDTIFHIAGLKNSSSPKLFVSTPNGVSEIEYNAGGATTIASYNSSNSGLQSDSIVAIALDTGKVVYFGSDMGLNVRNEKTWLFLNQVISDEGTESLEHITSMALTPHGWNYIGTKAAGVTRLRVDIDGVTGASAFSTEWSGLLSDQINDIDITESGNQWYATNKGVAYHEGYQTKEKWNTFTELSSELVSNKVQAIAVEDDGTAWAGTDNGISRFDGFSWLSFTHVNGISGISVFDIDVDVDGSVWFASNKGVLHYDEFGFPDGIGHHPGNFEGIELDLFPAITNGSVTLKYTAPVNSHIVITMMDLYGNIIYQVKEHRGFMGNHLFTWNINDSGKQVAPGLYIICLQTEWESICRTLIVV